MKQAVVAVLILLVLVAGAVVGYRRLFQAPELTSARIEAVDGPASVLGGEGTRPREVSVGDRLQVGDRVQTGVGGRVELSLQPEDRILITGDTEVLVKDLGGQRTVFELSYGQVQASLKPYAGRTVAFEAPGNEVKVQTHEGSFTMTHDGWGTFDVVPTDGEVELVRGDQVDALPTGVRTVVGADGEPHRDDNLERAVLLKVEWPGQAPVGAEVEVVGQADPGSQVTVAGQRAHPGADGSFTATVAVPEGGTVEVLARSSAGEAVRRSPDLIQALPPTASPAPQPPPPTPPRAPRLRVTQSGDWK